MPNAIVDRYRKALADQGVSDPRPDFLITLELGKEAEQENPSLFETDSDFASEYQQVREANAPSLMGEAGQALKAGFKGLGSTALGGAALVTGSDYLRDKALELDASAAENAPTVGSLEAIAPGQSGASRVLSRDALRYGISKVAGAVPSIVEAVGLAGAGAAVGTAIEPGAGTVVGAAEGAIEGLLGRGVIKSAIRSLLSKGAAEKSVAEAMAESGLIKTATEDGIAQAMRNGSQTVADIVTQQAKQIAARRSGAIVNAANSYGLSAGEIYNDTGDRGLSLGLGAIAAIPDTILPAVLLKRLFPDVALSAAKEEGKKYLARLGTEALKTVGIEGTTEGFQEAVGVVAKNLKAGRDPLDFDDKDWQRIREASISGAAGGLLAAPGAAMQNAPVVSATKEVAPQVAAPIVTAPVAEPVAEVVPPERRVALMDDAQQKARLEELTAKGADMTPDEFAEHDLLQVMVGEVAPPPVITEPAPVAPAEEAIVEPAPVAPEAAPVIAEPAPVAETNPQILDPARESVPVPQPVAPIEALAQQPEPPPAAPRPAPTLEQRLREELTVPAKFNFGKVNEGNGVTVDLRTEPRFELLTPQQAAKLPVVNALDDSGNKAKTRVAVVLEAPDGHYVKAGLLVPQELAKAGTSGKEMGPGVQLFANESRQGGEYQKTIAEGGKKPALLSDVIAAGYKLRAIVHFDQAPGVIFQRFKNAAEYDAAYAGTERTTGRGTKTAPAGTAGQGMERSSLAKRMVEIDSKIEQASQNYETAQDPAAKAEFKDEIDFLYHEKSKLESAGQSMTGNAGVQSSTGGSGLVDSTSPSAFVFRDATEGETTGAQQELLDIFRANLARGMGLDSRGFQLRHSLPSGVVSKTGDPSKTLARIQGLVRVLGNTFGKEIIFFRSTVPIPQVALTADRAANTILINVDARNPIAALFGHELGHNLSTQRPDLYAKFSELVMGLRPPSEEYRALKREQSYPEDRINHEWISDVIGSRFDEPAFWYELGRAAEARGLSAQFRDVVAYVKEWLTKTVRKIVAALSPEAAEGLGRDIDRVRKALAETIVDYVAGGPYSGAPLNNAPGIDLATPTPIPVEADRAQQFASVTARLRQAGGQVDVFAKTFLNQSLRLNLEERLNAAKDDPARAQKLQEQLAALDRVRGVTYSPQHIAVGLEDVQKASMADLVTLIHEAGHGLLASNPAMHGRVIRAVDGAFYEIQKHLAESQAKTGVTEVIRGDPEELIVSAIAQKLAVEGVPEAPSLARAIFQWAKDLYFRLAMSVQAAFGREPSSQMALDWFENQMRRLTGGDYDYRLANLWAKLLPEHNVETFGRFTGSEIGSTPGHVVDFVDPVTQKMSQPTADLSTADGVTWNLKFATDEEAHVGKELDIPQIEARARWHAAAINEEADLAQKVFKDTAPKGMSFEQFWKVIGRGDLPAIRLAVIAAKVPGAETARIGGERMTDTMNGLARVEAKRLVMKMEWKGLRTIATNKEAGATAEAGLKDQAALVNKREKDLRNADMQQATMSDKLKGMIRDMAKGMKRGLDTAFASGELAQAVREAEGLLENDAIPMRYQEAFKAILADQVPIFDYLDGIASLDFNLKDMTLAEIKRGVRDSAEGNAALSRLIEPKNKPLFIALTVLAKKNAEQMDQIQLRRASQEQFMALHGDLKEIREAGEEKLKELSAALRDQTKAATFADRIKQGYLEERAKLRRLSNTIKQSEERRMLAEKANVAIAAKREEMETSGMPAPSEWRPFDGATWTAMQQTPNGSWSSVERTLRFTKEGPAVEADRVRSDLAANWQYLQASAAKAGSKHYETVKKQTRELAMLDVQRQYHEGMAHLMDKIIGPLGQQFQLAGHAPGARADQMLKKFQFINFYNWGGDLEDLSHVWTHSLTQVEEAAGIKDHGNFFAQIYDPVLYLMQTETGLDEGPALREAVRAARLRLPKPPADNFDVVFKDFLRKTKDISERVVQIAEEHGLFVADKRLGGELRRAVAQGWLTVMRRVDSSVVATIVRDMDAAGWKLEFKDAEGTVVKESFDQAAGGSAPRRVVASTTFDGLMPENAKNPQDEQARIAVLTNPQSFAQAISGFFTPGIIGRWLEPFINKPGDPLFYHNGEAIEQMDVQHAWQNAAGDVAKWIDELSKSVRLTVDEKTNEKLDVLPAFRASMLKQIDGLFLMESRIAYEASQTKNLFDPMGPKGHTVMDGRANNLIPAEHLQHMVFDSISTKNLLATVAFHAAFGRNGESMTQALDELKGNLTARKQQFEQLRGTTKAARKADAIAKGLDYDGLKRAAKIHANVMSAQEAMIGQFGFNTQAGVLGDLRTGMEVLQFVVGQSVNNPKTGLLNLLQLTQRAIARKSLGPSVIKGTASATGEFGKQVMGSFLENFGLHIWRASEHAIAIGNVHGQAFGQLPRSVAMSDIGRRGNMQGEPAIKALRKIRDFQRHGLQPGFGSSKEFHKFNLIPGIGSWIGTLSNMAATSNGIAEVRTVESLVLRIGKYFAAHPEDAANPAFRVTAKELGMENKIWFDDSGSFSYFRNKLVEYGVGNLEDIARAAADRATKGEPLLTKEQAIKIALMSGNELDLMAGINTNPASWNNNAVLKFMTPLLGWPIRQMNQVHQAMRTAEGRWTIISSIKAIGILGAWSLPMGLAFTLLTDQYDEKILKKKSGLGDIDTLTGVAQRLGRAGNIYGLGFDVVAQTLTGLDPTSGQRPFSMDSRILVFSQFNNVLQALTNWINTGGSVTWATVEKPLVMAMGGNAAIHALDIFNGLLGLDNSESRMVQRTNAQQWLRTAGREAGVEIRRSGGASVSPTPVSIWVREMQLAAYANDRMDFLDAYRKAVDAAREGGDDDPEKKVLESWRSRNPLEVFRNKPTETEMRRIYSAMNDSGQAAVHEALSLYQQYSTLISPSAGEKYSKTLVNRLSRPPAGTTAESIRRRLAGSSLFAR